METSEAILTKDQETFLCRLADAFRNEIFETVTDDYILCDMSRMTAGLSSECVSGALCRADLAHVRVFILCGNAVPEGYGRLAYRITPKGYQEAVNALCRRALADGHTLYSADDVWDLYDLWT